VPPPSVGSSEKFHNSGLSSWTLCFLRFNLFLPALNHFGRFCHAFPPVLYAVPPPQIQSLISSRRALSRIPKDDVLFRFFPPPSTASPNFPAPRALSNLFLPSASGSHSLRRDLFQFLSFLRIAAVLVASPLFTPPTRLHVSNFVILLC